MSAELHEIYPLPQSTPESGWEVVELNIKGSELGVIVGGGEPSPRTRDHLKVVEDTLEDEHVYQENGNEQSISLLGLGKAIGLAKKLSLAIKPSPNNQAAFHDSKSKSSSKAWWFTDCDRKGHEGVMRTICCTIGKCSRDKRIY